MGKILNFNNESLELSTIALNKGNLVSFPTETVYGLGANALNEKAVDKIFEAKKRPKSDPLIVHIAKLDDAFIFTDMSDFQKTCFLILGNKFWPGPLTIIVNSSSILPTNVTSNSGFVGIRIPNHPVALQLLNYCGLPLAAPSANLFGHISPTSAQHVFSDIGYYEELIILETEINCQIGIESTIIKINENNDIILLRPGSISTIELQNELKNQGLDIKIQRKDLKLSEENTSQIESSGQFLTHYSPSIESFILKDLDENNYLNIDEKFMCQSVLIDFNHKNIKLKNMVLFYFDLSYNGNYNEASFNLFSILRKSELCLNAKYILLPNLISIENEDSIAIFDRIYRAASGKYI